MSDHSPDPKPEETPGLQPGGSVDPGDTPPAESSAPGAIDHQPDLPSETSSKVVYGIVIALGLVVTVMLIAYAVTAF